MWQPFRMLRTFLCPCVWRPSPNRLRAESLVTNKFTAEDFLPASLLLGYLSSDGWFQDPVWNPFVFFVLRICLQVSCFKLILCLCQTKWVDTFKLKIHWNIIPPLAIVTQTFRFGEWPYSSSLQGTGWMGVSLLTVVCLFFPVTYPLENHFLSINSSYLFLELFGRVFAGISSTKLQCKATQGKANFLLKIAILKAAHILSPSSTGTKDPYFMLRDMSAGWIKIILLLQLKIGNIGMNWPQCGTHKINIQDLWAIVPQQEAWVTTTEEKQAVSSKTLKRGKKEAVVSSKFRTEKQGQMLQFMGHDLQISYVIYRQLQVVCFRAHSLGQWFSTGMILPPPAPPPSPGNI